MDDSKTYMNVQLAKPDSSSPSGDEPNVSHVELHFKTLSDSRVRTNEDGLPSIYSVLKLPKDELRIDDDEDPPASSGPAELPVAAQAAAQEQESKMKVGNRPYRLICLFCLVTLVFFLTLAGLSIHVSQIRQPKNTTDRNYHEVNSTLQSKISENSRLDLSQKTCLKNLFAINSNLSNLKRMHSDLRHQFTEMETKYRSVNETKAQICELLTCRRDQTCSQDWISTEDHCYFFSTLETSFDDAKERCSTFDARLLKINSKQEQNIVSNALAHPFRTYWIGKCEDGGEASSLMYGDYTETSFCVNCDSHDRRDLCGLQHRFICEKRGHLYTDLCHQSIRPT